MEYQGILRSTDAYMNLHLLEADEWVNGEFRDKIGEVGFYVFLHLGGEGILEGILLRGERGFEKWFGIFWEGFFE